MTNPGASSLVASGFVGTFSDLEMGGFTYLIGYSSADGGELWKIDNTTRAISKVKDLNPGTGDGATFPLLVLDATHFLFNGYSPAEGWEPRISDGSAAGTQLVKDVHSGPSRSHAQLTVVDAGYAYFSARDTDLRTKIFRTDGTSAGTVALSETTTVRSSSSGFGTSSPPRILGELDGKLLFAPYRSGEEGIELWTTEGTEASTQLVKDIWASDTNSATVFHLYQFGKLGDRWIFNATDDALGHGIWVTDGTGMGTMRIGPMAGFSAPNWVASLSDSLGLFVGNDVTNGSELWVTDGTAGGTHLLVDAVPGATGSAAGQGLILGGIAIFPFYTPAESWELWKSDGTVGGTGVLKNFIAGASGGFGGGALAGAVLGSVIVFAAADAAGGTELWVTDGTLAGTQQVKDIYPGVGNSSSPTQFIQMGSKVFFTAVDGVNGRELWVTDGTLAGTQLVKDIAPGAASSGISYSAVLGSGSSARLLFNASDSVVGSELWISDGTAAGTMLLKDIRSGSASGLATTTGFTVIGSYAYFSADDGVHGSELWRTDGTTAGTILLQDIMPGSVGSWPAGFAKVGTKVYFAADTPLYGIELLVLEADSP